MGDTSLVLASGSEGIAIISFLDNLVGHETRTVNIPTSRQQVSSLLLCSFAVDILD